MPVRPIPHDGCLTSEKKAELEGAHDKALSRRHGNRIKVIFLVSEVWKPVSIAQALRLIEETVRKHIRAHVAEGDAQWATPKRFFLQETEGDTWESGSCGTSSVRLHVQATQAGDA